MVQIFMDLIFDLHSVIENKILSKITGYTIHNSDTCTEKFFRGAYPLKILHGKIESKPIVTMKKLKKTF